MERREKLAVEAKGGNEEEDKFARDVIEINCARRAKHEEKALTA